MSASSFGIALCGRKYGADWIACRPAHDGIVLADGDARDEAAVRDCATRWAREGRRARIARPPPRNLNDQLTRHLPERWSR